MRDRFFAPELGFVADRDDPQRRGRVRVHVPSILGPDNVEDNWTDWALPKSAGLDVPPLGAPVVVTFEKGYVTHPFYEHGWIRGTDTATSEAPKSGKGELDPAWTTERRVDTGGVGRTITHTVPADTATRDRPVYPENHVRETPGGHVFEVDDSENRKRARYHHPSGTTILVDADGSVHIRAAGAIHMEPSGDFGVALRPGGTFKVVYPGGSGIAVGAHGVSVSGHAANILGRTVRRNETDI